ncbi:hypothetical protein [Rivularia sp. UHCC 0363]|uniref:hypothetical protein n=1 Tax=Rivularia sp. UHCC 0363 TaxID=3110244 RepID=UPI002B1E94A0|nr:hypothetical protein [Rivularia sp. UHCC 0363]MEA5594088.1 hypothetical protein [Rivularia sp. UHCC 0363]
MKSFKLGAVILGSIGLIFLGACSSNQPANSEDSAASKTEPVAQTTPIPTETVAQKKEGEHGRGGQIIESGEYHLEFVAAPSENGTNIDFFLEKGEKHETVSDAKITAQVQLPSGEQKTIPIKYEASENHYHGKLSETAPGEYKVAIISEVNGEKVNGRFNFKR